MSHALQKKWLNPDRKRSTSLLVHSREMFAFVGPLGLGTVHRHPVPACLFALDGPFRIRLGEQPWQTTFGALIPANIAHEFDGAEQQVAVCYLDPFRAQHRLHGIHIQLADQQAPWCRLGRRLAADLAEAADPASASTILVRALQESIGKQAGWAAIKRPDEPRFAALEHGLESSNSSFDLTDAAREACLSPSRFSHRFTALTGVNWTRYSNWQRLLHCSSQLVTSAQPLTAIAMDRGYANPSHLSTAFRNSFGVAPSQIRPKCT